MSDVAISVRNLTKRFVLQSDRRDSVKERFVRGRGRRHHTFTALEDVSFDIERGTTFGLIGHNGSGKSTLLKILAGVYRPSGGQVLVDGRVSALLELGAGFHGELTGRENIYLNGSILGMGKRQIDASIDEIIDFADIGDFIDSPVKVYSSGMYVRLGFAIAVTLDPEILIVDEIIAVGDEDFQRKSFDYLHRLRKRGTTIALVTHSMSLAADLCSKAVWLDHGKVRMIGASRDVVDAYISNVNAAEAQQQRVPDNSVASPGKNRLGSGQARMTHVDILQGDEQAQFALAGQPVTIRVHIRSLEAIDGVEVGLAIHHETGMILAGPSSVQQGIEYDIPKGDSFVDFLLDPNPLLAGTYYLTTNLQLDGESMDYADREVEFRVRSGKGAAVGVFRMEGRWSERCVAE